MIKNLTEGMYISANFKTNPDSSIYGNVFLPLKVDKEYKYFYKCTVLPHINPIHSYGLSKQYTMTIDKFDLKKGYVTVREFSKEAYIEKLTLLDRLNDLEDVVHKLEKRE